MTTFFEARSRLAIESRAAASAVVATIARSIGRACTALNGSPRIEVPRAFAPESQSPTSAFWILHAR